MPDTFLTLCQRLRRESGGIAGSGPTTVVGNTIVEYQRIVDWINDAYMEIAQKQTTWRFLHFTFSRTVTAGTAQLTAREMTHDTPTSRFDVRRFDDTRFRYYPVSAGQIQEQRMYPWPIEEFLNIHRFQATRTQTGQPLNFAVDKHRNVLFAGIPDVDYVVTGEGWRMPIRMAADADEPLVPDEHRMLIMWWALVKYAGLEESSFKYQHALNMLNAGWTALETQELDDVVFGDALA